MTQKLPNPKYIPKPYEQTQYPRQRIQIDVKHKLIRSYTPHHNGKVERSHCKDNEYFYATHRFYSFEDFQKQLAVHSRKYNDFPMRPLGWKSPNEYLNHFLSTGEVF